MSWLFNTDDMALCICHQSCQPHTITLVKGGLVGHFKRSPYCSTSVEVVMQESRKRKLFHSELVARGRAPPLGTPRQSSISYALMGRRPRSSKRCWFSLDIWIGSDSIELSFTVPNIFAMTLSHPPLERNFLCEEKILKKKWGRPTVKVKIMGTSVL